ncbi:unnamed protein product [Gordionus sp. m RMFG-2023]
MSKLYRANKMEFNEDISCNCDKTNEFDCIDSDLIIDTIIPKGPPLQFSNECESIFSDSIISSCKYPKRRNNDIDEIKTLLKLEHEKTKLELEMTKNRYNEYAICHVMREKLDRCSIQEKKDLSDQISIDIQSLPLASAI